MHRLAGIHGNDARRVATFGLAWCVLALVACGGGLAPILNVENAPVVSTAATPPTRPFVRDAIVRALVSRNWQIEKDGLEGITATIVTGAHTATVLVQYDEHAFSIHHVSSSPNLKFDGSAIHRRYNQWIDRLRLAIRAQLAAPSSVTVGGQAEPAVVAVPVGPPPATGAPVPPDDAPPPPPPPPPSAAPGK